MRDFPAGERRRDTDALALGLAAPPMRFGAAESLYRFDETAAFCKGRSPVNLSRTVQWPDLGPAEPDVGTAARRLADRGRHLSMLP
jgi:hypothetical protein